MQNLNKTRTAICPQIPMCCSNVYCLITMYKINKRTIINEAKLAFSTDLMRQSAKTLRIPVTHCNEIHNGCKIASTVNDKNTFSRNCISTILYVEATLQQTHSLILVFLCIHHKCTRTPHLQLDLVEVPLVSFRIPVTFMLL